MIRFRMIRINVDQFAILSEDKPSGEISVSISLAFKISNESERIACFLDVSFEKDNIPLMILKMNCEFQVSHDDWNAIEKDGELLIPIELQQILATQTIGVSRGILYSKVEGTPFSNFILPPINVVELLGE